MKAVVLQQKTTFCVRTWVWLPLAVLLVAICTLASPLPAWQFMGVLAVATLMFVKWLTIAREPNAWNAPTGRLLTYALLWPGLDAKAFCDTNRVIAQPRIGEWLVAAAKTLLGIVLFFVVAPRFVADHELVAGWFAMAGFVFIIHFGLAHVASLAFRRCGVDAPPLMNAPILATSLSDFWGRRWNRAFRDFAEILIFQPLVRPLGIIGSTMAVFLFSGMVHDAVISLPARAGWGLPTLFFLIQGVGLLVERSRLGRRLGLNRGLRGRLFCATLLVAPAGLLFHPPFVHTVVVPMLVAITGAKMRGLTMNLTNLGMLIFVGGIFHFGILIASALVPQVLDWKDSLRKLDPLLRQLIWVHGAFIVLVIIGFGLISLGFAGPLAAGSPLARGVCFFIGFFWMARLGIQFFVFDARPFLKTTFLKLGYHALTMVFLYNAVVYSLVAIQ